jgi:hypothetical protein
MFSDWVSFLTYPNLFEIKGFIVVVVVIKSYSGLLVYYFKKNIKFQHFIFGMHSFLNALVRIFS